jgi:hypothetical protein
MTKQVLSGLATVRTYNLNTVGEEDCLCFEAVLAETVIADKWDRVWGL